MPPPAPHTSRQVFKLAPSCVNDFVNSVSGVDGVRCVVAEEAEGGCLHITTFVRAKSLIQGLRDAIYDREIAVMRANPGTSFDFHLRENPETGTALPSGLDSKYYFAIWGSLDAGVR